ncbi:MAG: hypothetical protein FWH43_05890 [Endomicrobia bacterium]|nr:hypothetical protein [Endomicrobiia bacterium]
MAIAQIIACGGAVNDLQTSFNNVFSCPQNTGIQIDRQNNVQFYSLIENMYYKMHQQEWDIQFGKARQDCLDFLAKANIVSGNITGGFDSRVALALAIEAGIYKNIQFSVIGYADHPDVVIAKQIAKHYGLKLEHKETVITNVDNNLLDRIYDVALKRQYKQAGMRAFSEDLANAAYGIGPQRKKINNINKYSCSLAGTALEFFRGYLSLHKLLMNNYQNKIMGSQDREFLIQDTVEKRLLSQAAYNFFHRRLESHFKSYEDLYSYDLRFTQARMPQFHAGLNNTAFSFGMHPLLHRLAMIQAPELRAAGAIHFKLIESCASDLLYFPFANKKWHYFVYAGTKYETKIKQVAPFANVAKRSFPSSTNSLKYVEHWFSKNLELNDSVWNTYDRKWLIASIGNAKDMVCGKKYVNNGILSKLLDVIGNSLFLDNQEISCVQNNISQKIPLNFPDIPLKKNIYSPLQTYVCSAQEICLAGQLLFSKNKIFRAVDHMELTAEQKKLFSNAVAANKSIPRFLGKIICCFIPKQRNRHHFMQKHVKDK